MSQPKYNVNYFLKKFEAIPEEKWCKQYFQSPDDPKSYCALGHCGMSGKGPTAESIMLTNLFKSHSELFDRYTVVAFNDGVDQFTKELGDTPKERIINALTLIAAGVEL